MIERSINYEEHNVGRLGLLSIMSRIPAVYSRKWTSEMIVGGLPGQIRCFAGAEDLSVPHGFDNDVSMAIHTLYILAGCPDDGKITTTSIELLRTIGLEHKPHYRRSLEESLRRLHYAHYEIEAHWFSAKRKKRGATHFTYLSNFALIEDQDPDNDSKTEFALSVTLNEHVRNNLTLQHLITLRPDVLNQLGRYSPTTRAVYRMLEALRHDPSDVTRSHQTLHLNMADLASLGRVLAEDQRGSRVLRFFEPSLLALQNIGYLKKCDVTGRGSNMRLDLEFTTVLTACDAHAYALLIEHGVWENKARELASQHSFERVQSVVDHVEGQQNKVRSKASYLVKVLDNHSGGTGAIFTPPVRPISRQALPEASHPPELLAPIEISSLGAGLKFFISTAKRAMSAPAYAEFERAVTQHLIPEVDVRAFLQDPSDDAWDQLKFVFDSPASEDLQT